MKILFSKLTLTILVGSIIIGGLCFLGACGSSSGDEETSDEPGTSTEAEEGAEAAVNTTLLVLSQALSGENASLSTPHAATSSHSLPKSLTVTEASSCSGVAPSPVSGGSSFTVYGTDLSAGGSGSCTVSMEDLSGAEMNAIYAVLSCSDFNGAEATNYVSLDGSIGIALSDYDTSGENAASIRAAVGTDDFLMGFVQDGSTRLCEIEMYITEIVTITVGESSASSTVEYDGCVSVCGSAFDLSGSDSETYTF